MFARVTFTHLVVHTGKPGIASVGPDDSDDSDDFGGSDDTGDAPLVAEVFFRLEVDGRRFPDASVEVVHPDAGDLESGPFEISPVRGSYRGEWSPKGFRQHVERYVRDLVEKQGYQLDLGRGATTSITESISDERECWLEIA